MGGSGDSGDGFIYNNAAAAGNQMYPQGLSKYYDMYSWDGFIAYAIEWIIEIIWAILSVFTILPIPAWIMIFDGGEFGDVITYLIWYPNWFGLTWLLASF